MGQRWRVMLVVLALAGLLSLPSVPSPLGPPEEVPAAAHAPILITSNAEFTAANGIVGGSGTVIDPYVIAGWDIDATSSNGIEIRATDAAFVLRDTTVRSTPLTLDYTGILLDGVSNGRLENVTVEDTLHGVWGVGIQDLVIVSSSIARAGNYGIYLGTATNLTLTDNVVREAGVLNTIPMTFVFDGVALYDAHGVTITGNDFLDNDHFGVNMYISTEVTISDNRFEGNWGGSSLWEGANVEVARNTVANQAGYGLDFLGVKNVTVEDNLISNALWGILFSGILGDPVLQNENVTVRRNVVVGSWVGMGIDASVAPRVYDNQVLGSLNPAMVVEYTEDGLFTGNVIDGSLWDGVRLYQAHRNNFTRNNLTGIVNLGLYAIDSQDNTLIENRIAGNGVGVALENSTGWLIHHNNFEGNAIQAQDDLGAQNEWDDGFPSGGNWWSDYGGIDQCTGPLQNICPSPDGLGDTPYVIDFNSQDDYPLTTPAELPPHAAFNVTPSTGDITTVFSFDANATWDPNEPPGALEVRWDWEDDGTWDTGWSVVKNAAHMFPAVGTYDVRMEVRDSTGLTNETTRSVAVINTAPVASFTVSPLLGGLAATFTANASSSSDFEDPASSLEVRWDWEDDGTWDTTWTTAQEASHIYGVAGLHTIRLEVRDSGGLTDTVTATVEVRAGPVTTLLLGAPNYTAGSIYITATTPLAFSVVDNSALGILRTEYRVDAGPWSNYTLTGPFSIAAEGTHTLEWFSEDGLGNLESVRNETLVVDSTPPSLVMIVGAPSVVSGDTFITSSTPLNLTVTDGGSPPVGISSVEYRTWSGGWTAWAPFAGPITLSGEGRHYLEYRATDLLGNSSPVGNTTVVVDDTAPVTALQIGTPNVSGATTYVTSATAFTLTATDAGSGLDFLEWRVDGGPWTPYTGPFTLSGEGSHTIEYLSRDLLGNLEAAWITSAVVDDSPPTTSLAVGAPTASGAALFITPVSSLTLTATDGGANPVGVASSEYRVDGGSWTPYVMAFFLTAEGAHLVEYRSVDRLGNVESVQGQTLVVDATPPATGLMIANPVVPGPTPHITAATPLVLLALDGGIQPAGLGGTEYSIDSGPWIPYAAAFTIATEGGHTVRYRSWDRLNNTEPTMTTALVVDNTAPTTTLEIGSPSFSGTGEFVAPTTPLDLLSIDGGIDPVGLGSVEYRIWTSGTWSGWTAYSLPFTFGGGDGPRAIEFYALDLLGNAEAVRNATLLVDGTPPVTGFSESPGDVGETVITLTALDAGSGVLRTEYSADGGNWTEYSGPFVLGVGTHELRYRSVDRLSNLETESSEVVIVEGEPPAVNLKPLVATVFAVLLALIGWWLFRKHSPAESVMRAWMRWTLPFVAAEAATGVLSAVTGWLAIPPLFGAGTAVDVGILLAGIGVAFWIAQRDSESPARDMDSTRET